MSVSNYFNIEIQETLVSNNEYIVYRGKQQPGSEAVLLKIPHGAKENGSVKNRVQAKLYHEYEILKGISLQGIPSVVRLAQKEESIGLIMHDVHDGTQLSRHLEQRSLTLAEFFSVASALTESIGGIHRAGIIHKAIKPQNIFLTTPEKGNTIVVMDFAQASRLGGERQEIKSANALEMDLRYISPEQTGRMNRIIDWRTDLYSLGIVFYEILTGKVPFDMDDAMSMVHAHIAVQPLAPHLVKPTIPQLVSDIVMKLLAKTAEHRYQSAYGLKAELEACNAYINGQRSTFTLGSLDISEKFQVPQKLYGREAEVQFLMERFAESAVGKAQMLLVGGYSGVGKSALINEVHKPMVERRGYFIQGKFDQFKRNIPFSALVQAFGDLVKQLMSEPETKLDGWRKSIQSAVGSNGQVIVDLLPEIERIIGRQAALTELGAQESQNRFNTTLERFVKCFTTSDHPLVLFLDDLQWADSPTLTLLTTLMATAEQNSLLVIGAYRNNEVDATHPFSQAIREIQKAGGTVSTLMLKPLGLEHITELIFDTVKSQEEQSRSLASIVWKKTEGNPFFVGEMLQAMHRQEIIRFSREDLRWVWSMEEVEAAQVSDNVVELMIQRLEGLPEETRRILRLASCIGNIFELEILAIIAECSEAEAAQALWAAVVEGLILPIGEGYKFVPATDTTSEYPNEDSFYASKETIAYQFLHDRVQQAAYSLINAGERQIVHLKIGKLLRDRLSEAEMEERIFDVVGHLNSGRELIHHATERIGLAMVNLAAGKKAKLSSAYSTASILLETAMNLMPENAWQTHYEQMMTLYAEATEAMMFIANYPAMESIAGTALKHSRSSLDASKIQETRMKGFLNQSKYTDVLETGAATLHSLGIAIPSKGTTVALLTAVARAQWAFRSGIPKPETIQKTNDKELQAVYRIFQAMMGAAFFSDELAFPMLICTVVRIMHERGYDAETSGYIFSLYGLVVNIVFNNHQRAKSFADLGIEINHRFQSISLEGRTNFIFGAFINWFFTSQQKIAETLFLARNKAADVGDFEFAGYALSQAVQYTFFTGRSLQDGIGVTEQATQLINKWKQDTVSSRMISIYRQTVQNLTEPSEKPYRIVGEYCHGDSLVKNAQVAKDKTALGVYHIVSAVLNYRFGQFEMAQTHIQDFRQYKDSAAYTIIMTQHNIYSSLSALALWHETVSPSLRRRSIQLAEKNQKTLKKWAMIAPFNFQHHYELVEAELQAVKGHHAAAEQLYSAAIESAQRNDFINDEGLANELAGLFYQRQKNAPQANAFVRRAHECYGQWGAVSLQARLEQKYPEFFAATTLVGREQADKNDNEVLDMQAVVKASQTLSGEIDLERLLSKLMIVVLEASGAEKAGLILWQNNQLLVQAEAVANGKIDVMQGIPLDQCHTLPISLLTSVERFRTPVVLADAANGKDFASDTYIRTKQIKSALALPILNQGTLSGVLYTENNLATDVFTQERVELLTLLSSQIAISIANAQLVKNMTQMERLKKEMEMAAGIQMGMLPKNLPTIPNYEIDVFVQMAKEAGGDFYDVIPLGNDEFVLLIGDVSGKGMPAALYMSAVMNVLRTTVLQATLDGKRVEPSAVLKIVNRMMRQTMSRRNFVTIWMGVLNTTTHELRYCSAGHDPAFLWNPSTQFPQLLETEGHACGFTGFEQFDKKLSQETITIPLNGTLYWNTDGITEAQNAASQEYTDERYWENLRTIPHSVTAHGAIEIVMESVKDFVGSAPQHDDMTMLVMQRKG